MEQRLAIGLRRELSRAAEFLERTLTGPIGVARSMGPRRLVRGDLSEAGPFSFADSGLLDELSVELGIL